MMRRFVKNGSKWSASVSHACIVAEQPMLNNGLHCKSDLAGVCQGDDEPSELDDTRSTRRGGVVDLSLLLLLRSLPALLGLLRILPRRLALLDDPESLLLPSLSDEEL